MTFHGQYLYFVAIFAFVIYRRIKRSIGFQPYQTKRLKVRMTIFFILGLLLLLSTLSHPISLLFALIGAIIGVLLLSYAIKHCTFETRDNQLYYRTHIWIESLVLFIFIGRFVYRFIQMFEASKNGSLDNAAYGQHFTTDPSTMIAFFIIIVYYVGFFFYVLKKGKTLQST